MLGNGALYDIASGALSCGSSDESFDPVLRSLERVREETILLCIAVFMDDGSGRLDGLLKQVRAKLQDES